MSPSEQVIESILLKERWTLIQGGVGHKSIRISVNSSIYVNNEVFGRVVDSQFQHTNNYYQSSPANYTVLAPTQGRRNRGLGEL